MKEITDRIHGLGRKAALVKQAVENAPARVAEIRQAVALTTGQLQQLRSEVQVNVAGLRATDGQRMVALLTEILGQAERIREAGYEIAGVELEVDPVQRVFLLLDKVNDASAAHLQALLAAPVTRPGLHGLLVALFKAEELADTLVLPGLSYRRLRVEVGPVPTIRLCWHAGTPPVGNSVPPIIASVGSLPPAAPSKFGENSFFERRPSLLPTSFAATQVSQLSPIAAPSNTVAPSVPVSNEGVPPEELRRSALDRFKKMPDLGKRAQ